MLRYIFLIITFSCVALSSRAQFCTGTLGDNIFLEGDFGSGTANLLSPNPNIAPGYMYVFNVPPDDGEYVITNNTAIWPGLYPSWLAIGDNSSDPNGYMMVVNASNASGLFYEQTVSGLCPNTLYEFSADIINLISSGTPDHINPNVSFLLNGTELFNTGDILQTNNWTTYGFTFTTLAGQQSLTLSLQNNAPGGNGNDLAIDNISFRACGPVTLISPEDDIINICEDDPPTELQASIIGNQYVNPVFQWQQSFDQGLTWVNITGGTSSLYTPTQLNVGPNYFRFLVADGINNLSSDKCRVNSSIKIINLNLPTENTQTYTICEGQTLMIGNSVYSETGIYMDTFINSVGCDSLEITDLTISTPTNFTADLISTPACINPANGSISIENVMGGTPPYTYFFEGMDAGTTTLFSNLVAGETYSVVIQDDIGCTIELSTLVEEQSDLLLDLGEDLIIELGETIVISPTFNFTPTDFNWQSATPIECNNLDECTNFDYVPTTSQILILELMSESGCLISDSIFIEVNEIRNVFIPNIFSPNSDGINDLFTVFGKSPNIQIVEEFLIFDRWGNLIFENKNFDPNVLENGWDGKLNNELVPPGIYVYTANIRFLDNAVVKYSGELTIVQ